MSQPAAAFGTAFSPHMFVQRYQAGAWQPAGLLPYGSFEFPPSSAVFHYAQEIFEGLKCYRQPDGALALFRPEQNFARFNRSAARMSMPAIDEAAALSGLESLLRLDAASVPAAPGTQYIRPFMLGIDPVIRVKPADQYLFCMVTCTVGDYFAGADPRGVRLRTETEYTRAAPGGTGAAKCGGNYAASLIAQGRASAEGFDQVVWLDAREHRYIEEMGGMNIMFVLDGKLVTPSLDTGTILPGVTRDSLLRLAHHLGVETEERMLATDELIAAQAAGRLSECFACGTAAVITPIREILHRGEVLYRNEGSTAGALTLRLKQMLTDIQFGRAPDPFGWRHLL